MAQLLYRIIGPHYSTQLAVSPLGKFIFAQLFKGKSRRIYTTNEGFKLELTPNEAMHMGIALLGTYNIYETQILKHILKKGDIFLDAGAYVDGWYSFVAAKNVGNTGKVYAIEPSKKYFSRFLSNIRLNKTKNIYPYKIAFSNRSGYVTLYDAGLESSIIKKNIDKKVRSTNGQEKVKCMTIDNFLVKEKVKKVDLIKIDVEGADMLVLQGANKLLLRKNAPDLIVEVVDQQLKDAGSSAEELLAYLNKLGYRPYQFSAYGLALYLGNKIPTHNLFFSKKEIG